MAHLDKFANQKAFSALLAKMMLSQGTVHSALANAHRKSGEPWTEPEKKKGKNGVEDSKSRALALFQDDASAPKNGYLAITGYLDPIGPAGEEHWDGPFCAKSCAMFTHKSAPRSVIFHAPTILPLDDKSFQEGLTKGLVSIMHVCLTNYHRKMSDLVEGAEEGDDVLANQAVLRMAREGAIDAARTSQAWADFDPASFAMIASDKQVRKLTPFTFGERLEIPRAETLSYLKWADVTDLREPLSASLHPQHPTSLIIQDNYGVKVWTLTDKKGNELGNYNAETIKN